MGKIWLGATCPSLLTPSVMCPPRALDRPRGGRDPQGPEGKSKCGSQLEDTVDFLGLRYDRARAALVEDDM